MNTNIDFNQIKQTILPYFVKIYGEKYTDLIVERMNQIESVFYSTAESKKFKVNEKKKEKVIELTFRFLEEHQMEIPEEIKNEIITGNSTLPFKQVPEIKNLLEVYFGTYEYNREPFNGIKNIVKEPTENQFRIQQSVETLQKIGVSVPVEQYNQWLSTDESKHTFQMMEEWNHEIEKLDVAYDQHCSQFEEVEKYIQKSEHVKREINEKYMIDFLCSIRDYMSKSDQDLLDEYQMSEQKDWYSFRRQMKILKIVGENLNSEGLMTSFGMETDQKLASPDTPNFTKNCIIENRIDYYKLIGLYHDQMPKEEFLNTKEAKDNILKQNYIEDILSKKEQFQKQSEDEYIMMTSTYQENLKQIETLGISTEIDLEPKNLKDRLTCILPQTKIVNGKPEQVPLLLFSIEDSMSEYIDVRLIHEINHAIELSLLEYHDGKATYKCGFEVLSDEDDQIRNYEQFSEITNHVIAMEIAEAMHQDGVYLFDNPNMSKIKGGTGYEKQLIFMKDFWHQFRESIIASRVDYNLDLLFETVGRENFEALNQTINEYVSLPYYDMMEDVLAHRTTPLTVMRDELINRASEIMNQMVAYSNQMQFSENSVGMQM